MKKGDIFEHAHWLNASMMPLLCIVTSVRGDTVYWKAWAAGRPVGHLHRFERSEAAKSVGQVLQEAA